MLKCYCTVSICAAMFVLTTEREVVINYFELVANEINCNKDDGDIRDVLRPALDNIRQRLKDLSLSRSDLMPLADLVIFFTRTCCLAEVRRDLCFFISAIHVENGFDCYIVGDTVVGVPWTMQNHTLKCHSLTISGVSLQIKWILYAEWIPLLFCSMCVSSFT